MLLNHFGTFLMFKATKAISKGILLKSSIPILEPLVAYCSGLEIKVG